MDSKHGEAASAPLKYQTWFLKVSIHCEGCRRKVKKVLQNIDGVFTTTIDQQQQKVTVTGSVAVETLLKKLLRAGKHAEIWPENFSGNGKINGKPKNKSNNNKKDTESLKNHSSEKQSSESAASSNNKRESKSSNSKTRENSSEKSPAGDNASPENHNGGGGGGSVTKKKKKGHSGGNVRNNNGLGSGLASSSAPAHTGFQFQNEGQDHVGKEMGQVNLSPTRQQQPFLYPSESGYPPMVYVAAAYNRLYPIGSMGGPCYYVPPSPSPPYTCAGLDQDSYYYNQFQSRPLVSFEIFSDENANGCSVM